MTAYRLSQLTGVEQGNISRLKSGKIKPENLTYETAYRLADALGVGVFDIVDPVGK